MMKKLFRFYLNILRLYSIITTSTYSPVLMSGWRSRCICRGRGLSCTEFWKGKFQVRERFPNFLLVIEICLVIPIQTSCCKRGNSCLNRIMCDFQSTLGVSTVEALMRISINGVPPEHYHSALAVARWLDSGERARRPNYNDNLYSATLDK